MSFQNCSRLSYGVLSGCGEAPHQRNGRVEKHHFLLADIRLDFFLGNALCGAIQVPRLHISLWRQTCKDCMRLSRTPR